MQVIAEAGSTTRGSLDIAQTLASYAKEGNADAIKFIIASPENLISDRSIAYGKQNLYDVISAYQLTDNEYKQLADYCHDIKLDFFATCCSPKDVKLAESIGVSMYKIGGWDIRNYYVAEEIAKTGKPIQIDIGAAITGEVLNLLEYIYSISNPDISLIYESHGQSNEYNLQAIPYLKDRMKKPVGFSANDRHNTADLIAVGLGISSIEKRIKLDSATDGHHEDRALDPNEFKEWVKQMREAESMLGERKLKPSMKDIADKNLFYTSLCFAVAVTKGETITRKHLCCRRPGHGISPYFDYLFIGKRAKDNYKPNTLITYEMIGG